MIKKYILSIRQVVTISILLMLIISCVPTVLAYEKLVYKEKEVDDGNIEINSSGHIFGQSFLTTANQITIEKISLYFYASTESNFKLGLADTYTTNVNDWLYYDNFISGGVKWYTTFEFEENVSANTRYYIFVKLTDSSDTLKLYYDDENYYNKGGPGDSNLWHYDGDWKYYPYNDANFRVWGQETEVNATITFKTNPTTVGSITFDGITYYHNDIVQKPKDTYTIKANTEPSYGFEEWITTGGILVENHTQNETTATVTGDGTLKAKFYYINLGEAVDNTNLNWDTGGNSEWFGQDKVYYYDNDSAQSGDIGNNEKVWIKTDVTGPVKVKFWWKVDSEDEDYLRFKIDNKTKANYSGLNKDWVKNTSDIESGSHTLKWVYEKDESVSSGSDCGWLDKVMVGQLCKIDFYTNPSHVGYIIFDGDIYYNNYYTYEVTGQYKIEAKSYNHEFDHWSSTGDITITNPNKKSTKATVNGSGTIKAWFKYYFVHITDPHVYATDSFPHDERWEDVISRIRSFNPAPEFVLCSGDLADFGRDDIKSYEALKYPLIKNGDTYYIDSMCTIPIYFCPGNHDGYKWPLTWPRSFETYYDQVGPDYYSIINGNCAIFSINSGQDTWKLNIGWPWEWAFEPEGDGLDNKYSNPEPEVDQMLFDLDNLDGVQNGRDNSSYFKIFITHHPYKREFDSKDMVFWYNRSTFGDACKNYSVDALFSGHIHNNNSDVNKTGDEWKEGDGTRFIVTHAIAEDLGYRNITVSSSGLDVGPTNSFDNTLTVSGGCDVLSHSYDSLGNHNGVNETGMFEREIPYSTCVHKRYVNESIGVNKTQTTTSVYRKNDENYSFVFESLSNDTMNITVRVNLKKGFTSTATYENITMYEGSNATLYANNSIFNYTIIIKDSGGGTRKETPSTYEGNLPPETPEPPWGPTEVKKGVAYTYNASTIDPDYADQLYYNFSWGDGTYSGWKGPKNSGEVCNATHIWNEKGTYDIKVMAKDATGCQTNWSDSLPIAVPVRAEFEAMSTYVQMNEIIYGNDLSVGYYEIVNWTWNFNDGFISYEQNTSHYFATDGIYNVTLTVTDNKSNTDIYYQLIYVDSVLSEISEVNNTPEIVGFGFNIAVTTNATDNSSGIKTIKINVTYPDNSYGNFTMNNIENNTYDYMFSDTWLVGQYNYTIWVSDNSNNINSSSGHSFNVSANATISVCTIKDSYDNNETIDLTDPPSDPPSVGYELLDNGNILHIWNKHNSYYFNTSSGIQLTNHYDEYWSHNVFMLGYYKNEQWNLIYRTDELSGFNKDIDTDNETFVNATLWKDLTYKGYDFRLAIRYNLGVNDPDLSIIPYIKNIDDEDIPYALVFGWEIKDIKIADTYENDTIRLFNGSDWVIYNLNHTLDNEYNDMDYNTTFILEGRNEGKYFRRTLYLKWDHTLNYLLRVKSREGQYNAPVTLFIKIGTLAKDQEKYTMMNWLDSDEWLGISSSELTYACENKIELGMALDGIECWSPISNHDHEFILDLGNNYNVKKFKGRSETEFDPTDVDIYISTDNSTWETAVASDISTWQDTSTWVEINSTDKNGRYIKVVVQATEDENRRLIWGGFFPPGPIFDAYGEEVSTAMYYFNSYDNNIDWTTNPVNMADGNTSTYASTTIDGDLERCNGNTCPGITIGNISKVELRAYGYYETNQHDIILRPVFGGANPGSDYNYETTPTAGWSPWFDITDDNASPVNWNWTDIANLDCEVTAEDIPGGGPAFTLYCSKVEIRVMYYPGPEISKPYPPDGSSSVCISPTLNITVTDPEGDSMDITWSSNSSSSWQVFGANNSVNNGTYRQVFSNATENGKWWYWKVQVSDGTSSNESSVYKFYTGSQSKIDNIGSTSIKGYLVIQVQFYNTTSSTWVVAIDTINETTARTIHWDDPYNDQQLIYPLDTIFNGLVNTSSLSSYGNGTYRIYAAFRDPDGDILKCDDETELVATYEFTVTFE